MQLEMLRERASCMQTSDIVPTLGERNEVVNEVVSTDSIDEQALLTKSANRMLPILFTLALLAYLDRSNMSFAAHDLRNDTGIGDEEYGFGSSAFFVGYATLQLPSMLGARYFGAPCWLAATMSLWGVVAALFAALCCHLPEGTTLGGFYILRFLLGALESGAFPSMYYYLTLIFEADELTIYYARVTLSTAVAGIIGGIIAAALLSLDGVGGLRGWQWLFVAEGTWTLAFAPLIVCALPKEPNKARWLTQAEIDWLAQRRSASIASATRNTPPPVVPAAPRGILGLGNGWAQTPSMRALRNWRTWYCSLVWVLQVAAYYGIVFWMPILIGDMVPDASSPTVALLTAIPYTCASTSMLINAWHSKRTSERRWHCAVPVLVCGVCLALTPLAARRSTSLAMLLLCLATSGAFCTYGPFFSWPAVWAGAGPEAACSTAIINSLGNVGGMIGPALVGVLSSSEGGIEAQEHIHALLALGSMAIVAALMIAVFRPLPEQGSGCLSILSIPLLHRHQERSDE